jgi:hypothetical protein
MATNQTIESPNFEKIQKEAGQFTSDAIALLWAALNETRKDERTHFRLTRDMIRPKVLSLAPSADVDDLDLAGASVVSFTGAASVNFSGLRAPDTGVCQVVIVHVSGAGTITVEDEASSEAANQIATSSGANVTLSTGSGIILAYLSSKWREVT